MTRLKLGPYRVLVPPIATVLILLLTASPAHGGLNFIGTLPLSGTIVSPGGTTNNINALLSSGGFLYAGLGNGAGTGAPAGSTPPASPSVAEIDLTVFSHIATKICTATNNGPVLSLATDGSSRLFAGLGSSDVICQFTMGGFFADTSTFRRLTLAPTFAGNPAVSQCATLLCAVRALAVQGDNLFAGLDIAGGAPNRLGAVVKVSVSGFPTAGPTDQVCAQLPGRVYAMTIVQGSLYVAVRDVPPLSASEIHKIDMSTCTESAAPPITLIAPSETQISSLAAVNPTGGTGSLSPPLFAGLATQPGKIVKIDTATFTKVATLTLAVGEDTVNALAVESAAFHVVLAGLGGTLPPGGSCVVKIDPAGPTETARVCFPSSSSTDVRALAEAGTLFFAGLFTAPGQVVKVSDPPEQQPVGSTTTNAVGTGSSISATTSSTMASQVSTSSQAITSSGVQGGGAQITTTITNQGTSTSASEATTTVVATTTVQPTTATLVSTVVVVTGQPTQPVAAIPGFPVEAIFAGLMAGAAGLTILRRRRKE